MNGGVGGLSAVYRRPLRQRLVAPGRARPLNTKDHSALTQLQHLNTKQILPHNGNTTKALNPLSGCQQLSTMVSLHQSPCLLSQLGFHRNLARVCSGNSQRIWRTGEERGVLKTHLTTFLKGPSESFQNMRRAQNVTTFPGDEGDEGRTNSLHLGREEKDDLKEGIPIPPSKPKIWSMAELAVCKTPPPLPGGGGQVVPS